MPIEYASKISGAGGRPRGGAQRGGALTLANAGRNDDRRVALTVMLRKSDPAAARARAEALFKPRHEPVSVPAPVPTATAECKAAERAKSAPSRRLKTLGLPRGMPKHGC